MTDMTGKNETWVYAEQKAGHASKATLQLLGKAVELGKETGSPTVCVLVGSGAQGVPRELAAYGASKVYVVDDPRLELYQSEAYASVVAGLVKEHCPEIFLFAATDVGEDLAPRVAAKVGTGLTAHCIDLRIEKRDGVPLLHQTVPAWGGGMRIDIVCPKHRPQMATVKPGVFDLPVPKSDSNAEVVDVPAQLNEKHFRARTIEVKEEAQRETPLTEADAVVAVGWGAYSLGGIQCPQELAEAVCGTLAGTRPMVDSGWIPPDRMVGQSGKVVSSRLFISLGASGAMHFTSGFERAKFVVAVDQNPKAPIFQVADIGIVGDLREVLPCLTEEIKKQKSSKG
ncbi:MAG: electron transfer flavoprotein subunit alpha/FixB family protein [Chloroflexi bacterium]|nr:electron transfer flavoprotein subunit alpha/FixB family protein [Chloroflexota bacterium]